MNRLLLLPFPSSTFPLRMWRSIEELRRGTVRQRAAYATMTRWRVLDRLTGFDPALVSTVCVRVDLPESDLDVICELTDRAAFEERVRSVFGAAPGFAVTGRATTPPSCVARFDAAAFPVEIFAEARPVEEQYAWRHLTAMARLLADRPALRPAVRRLKRRGLSTEEAFADSLDLDGDPYEALLQFAPDEETDGGHRS